MGLIWFGEYLLKHSTPKKYRIKGEDGFNVSSCQFAMHYFFENPDTLQGFLRNVAECTRLNGYFIGTAYDGKLVFNLLKKIKTSETHDLITAKKVALLPVEYIYELM